jgi:hypothetical protein
MRCKEGSLNMLNLDAQNSCIHVQYTIKLLCLKEKSYIKKKESDILLKHVLAALQDVAFIQKDFVNILVGFGFLSLQASFG